VTTSVVVVGYNAIGKRVVDAIRQQRGFRLAGIVEHAPNRQRVLKALQLPYGESCESGLLDQCQLLVVCEGEASKTTIPCVYGPDTPVGPRWWNDVDAGTRVRVPCADAIAFHRLLEVLPPANRLFSNCARRVDRSRAIGGIDSMEPIFALPDEDRDLEHLGALQSPVMIRRTCVPYTQSHLHHVRCQLHQETSRDEIIRLLNGADRIRVRSSKAGFANTGQLQEFDRDIGRPRGDRPEVFIWEESIAVVDENLFLAMDVSPDATPIPEIMDAIRFMAGGAVTREESRRMTNEQLGLDGALC
jgi:hypothetical protein